MYKKAELDIELEEVQSQIEDLEAEIRERESETNLDELDALEIQHLKDELKKAKTYEAKLKNKKRVPHYDFQLENHHYKPIAFELGVLKALRTNKDKVALRRELAEEDKTINASTGRKKGVPPSAYEAGQIYAKRQLAAPYVTKGSVVWSNLAAPAIGLLASALLGGVGGAAVVNFADNRASLNKVGLGAGVGALLGALAYGGTRIASRRYVDTENVEGYRSKHKEAEQHTNPLLQLLPTHSVATNDRRALYSLLLDPRTEIEHPPVSERITRLSPAEQEKEDKDLKKEEDADWFNFKRPHHYETTERMDEQGNVLDRSDPSWVYDD